MFLHRSRLYTSAALALSANRSQSPSFEVRIWSSAKEDRYPEAVERPAVVQGKGEVSDEAGGVAHEEHVVRALFGGAQHGSEL